LLVLDFSFKSLYFNEPMLMLEKVAGGPGNGLCCRGPKDKRDLLISP
jgi:hypothetical protein